MSRKKQQQRDEELLAQMQAAARNAADAVPERIPDTYEARVAFEQGSLSTQLVGEINKFIRATGLSQQDLARRLGVSEGRVSQVLSGDQNLTIKTVASLAAAVGGHFHIVLESATGYPWDDDPKVDDGVPPGIPERVPSIRVSVGSL